MISDLWTLEPDGSPGLAATLADLGISRPSLSRQSQATGTLTFAVASLYAATSDTGWVEDGVWLLRRDGAPYYRGRVRRVHRDGGTSSESIQIRMEDAWGDLSETPYTQEWDCLGTGSIDRQTIRTTRALLCADRSGERSTTATALAQIMASAEVAGITGLTLSVELPALIPPAIEASNQSCAEMIRAVLRWHPGASAIIIPGESGDTLRIVDRSLAPGRVLALGSRPLSTIGISDRADLVVPDVHVFYETEATQLREVAGAEGDDPATIRAKRRLAVFTDRWPIDATVGRRSLVLTLPGPPVPSDGGGGGGASVIPPGTTTKVAIKTRTLPATGASGSTVEKWWLDKLGLAALEKSAGGSLDVNDIFIAATTATEQAHRVRFAWEADDTNDPMRDAPSAINPASTPLWRPPAVGDLPRELVSGTLAEWMSVKAAELVVDATVAVAKSAVSALNARSQKIFFTMRPREGTVFGTPAWLLDGAVRVIGTTAKTRVYSQLTATNSGDPAGDTDGSINAAKESVIVPDLARRIWEQRQLMPSEGSITLTAEEVGSETYLGKTLGILHPERPEWATMAAVVQAEALDIEQGETTITLGPPEHLSPQDWVALHEAGRRVQEESGGGSGSAALAPSPPVDYSEEDEAEDGPGASVIVPGTITPKSEVIQADGGQADPLPWDLSVVDAEAGTIKIQCGTIIKDITDVKTKLTIASADGEFNPSAGQNARLKITGEWTAPVCTLEVGGDWTDSPAAVETTGSNTTAEFASYFYPLWEFVGTAAADTIPIKSGLHARRLAPHSHLLRTAGSYHKTGDAVFAIPLLIPYHRALS